MSDSIPSLLQCELERLDWVQADLGRVLSWSAQTVSEVMQGKRRIDASMAVDLATVTNVSAELWLATQARHELRVLYGDDQTQVRANLIKHRARLERAAPVRELVRRGVVDSVDEALQEQQLKDLLEVNDLDDDPPYLANVSAKRAKAGTGLTRRQLSWIALGRRQARGVTAAKYDSAAFLNFASRLPKQVRLPADFIGLPRQFADCGVRLVHVPAFPGGQIDGVSLRLEDGPMIILSGRGKRFDRVLFALLHECAHIALGHWERGLVQVHEAGVVGDPEVEDRVNRIASEWVLPEGVQIPQPINQVAINALAERQGVSRALVVGQLQHAGILPWASTASRGLPKVEKELMTWP